jgi:prepilin-type N-terminal cleavage/methylation domain-containing protein
MPKPIAPSHTNRSRSRLRAGRGSNRGFSATEILVVLAIVGLIVVVALPFMLTSWPAIMTRWAARDVQAGVNRARLRAVTTAQSMCVATVPGGYQIRQGSCGGAPWTGEGTAGTGTFRPSNGVTVSDGGTSPVFTQFGTASTAGTLTVTGPGGYTVTITVWPSGRVTSS